MRKSNFAGIAIFLSFTAAAAMSALSGDFHTNAEKLQQNITLISNKINFQSYQSEPAKTVFASASQAANSGSHCHSSYIFNTNKSTISNDTVFAETSASSSLTGVCNEIGNPQWGSLSHDAHAYNATYENIKYDKHFFAAHYSAAPPQTINAEQNTSVPEPESLAFILLGSIVLLLQSTKRKHSK